MEEKQKLLNIIEELIEVIGTDKFDKQSKVYLNKESDGYLFRNDKEVNDYFYEESLNE